MLGNHVTNSQSKLKTNTAEIEQVKVFLSVHFSLSDAGSHI